MLFEAAIFGVLKARLGSAAGMIMTGYFSTKIIVLIIEITLLIIG